MAYENTIVLPKGSWWRSAGWRYSSGALHAAVDMAAPIGTLVRTPISGTVAEVSTGKLNNSPYGNGGSRYSGKPSNYVLLFSTWKGKKITLYFQHLNQGSGGVRVRKGQKINAGKIVGEVGMTGNTSGPHLHFHAFYGWSYSRYNNMIGNGRLAVYDPLKITGGSMNLSDAQMRKIGKYSAQYTMNYMVEDGAFPKDSKYRKTPFRYWLTRNSKRIWESVQNTK